MLTIFFLILFLILFHAFCLIIGSLFLVNFVSISTITPSNVKVAYIFMLYFVLKMVFVDKKCRKPFKHKLAKVKKALYSAIISLCF